MAEKNEDGGMAFPGVLGPPSEFATGMSLRDWFATHCPDSWIDDNTPKTVGAMRDAMIARGIIHPNAVKVDVFRSYTDADRRRFNVALRWDYADAMIAARKQKP